METKLLYKSIPSGQLQCRGTLIWNEATRSAVLIDPTDDPTPFLQLIDEKKLSVKALLLTHAHVDHAASCCAVARVLGLTPQLHPDDLPIYYAIAQHGLAFGIEVPAMGIDPTPLAHGQIIEIEPSFVLQVLHVPGHTPGGVTFYVEALQLAVVGDTLFYGSVGRTDLPGGSFAAIKHSIQTILYKLPSDTTAIPGHGPTTKIGYEMLHNPYVKS